MNILVAGIGNIFQGDDAFGCEVSARAQHAVTPCGVRLIDFGIRGLDLCLCADGQARSHDSDRCYFARRRSRELFTPSSHRLGPLDDGEDLAANAHAMNPANVFRMVRVMGGELGRVLLVGCEPADLGGEEGRMGLTRRSPKRWMIAADVVTSSDLERMSGVFNHMKRLFSGVVLAARGGGGGGVASRYQALHPHQHDVRRACTNFRSH